MVDARPGRWRPARRWSAYRSLRARRYNLQLSPASHSPGAAFVDSLIRRPRGGLLDLACGTGRHAVEFARQGWDVTGVDYSDDLLDEARGNAKRAGVHVRLLAQDMRGAST